MGRLEGFCEDVEVVTFAVDTLGDLDLDAVMVGRSFVFGRSTDMATEGVGCGTSETDGRDFFPDVCLEERRDETGLEVGREVGMGFGEVGTERETEWSRRGCRTGRGRADAEVARCGTEDLATAAERLEEEDGMGGWDVDDGRDVGSERRAARVSGTVGTEDEDGGGHGGRRRLFLRRGRMTGGGMTGAGVEDGMDGRVG